MSKEWGMYTWTLLHGIAEKCRQDNYEMNRHSIFNTIKTMITNLPCPECRYHAMQYFKNINHRMFPTKESLVLFLFNFHNEVNKRINHPIYNQKDLVKYKNLNFLKAINAYEIIMTRNSYNRLLGDQLTRRLMIKIIKPVLLDKNIFNY